MVDIGQHARAPRAAAWSPRFGRQRHRPAALGLDQVGRAEEFRTDADRFGGWGPARPSASGRSPAADGSRFQPLTGRPTIDDLYARADERLSKFDDWDATYYSQIVDPSSDVEPHELYGC